MTIQPGSRIGSYEILSPLGAGGMGEVWRAHDSRINRDVAIKVLPEEVTSDPDRLARFEQEAQAAGALNHPNILTVFEMGTHDGRPYLVTELLEGSSLREKLGDTRREPSTSESLPVRKALEIGTQVANGLAAAHDKGIVHRDLKPENIFVTTDGRVKILDFGLAKLTSALGSDSDLADAKTAQRQTSPGTVMGTAGYMAPEQVRGQNADHRVDIFACGVVLYEMLAGRRAFEGPSSADTMSAILKEDPPTLATEALHVPLVVDRIVRRCLEKETSQRFQSARDLAYALEAVEGSSISSGQAAAIEAGGTRPKRLAWITLALVAIVIAVVAYYAGTRRSSAVSQSAGAPAQDPARLTPLTLRQLIIFEAAFAPDHRTVVFSAAPEGTTPSIYTISPDYPEPRDAGLPGVHLLAISSKGEMAVLTHPRFMYHRQFEGTLARVPVGGTAPREILEGVRQAVWSPDGNELAIIREVDGVDRLEYPIGTVLHTTNGYLSDLEISPDNTRIAFFEHPQKGDDRGPIRVVDLEGNVTTLADGFWGAEGIAWAPDGTRIVFSADRTGAVYNLRSVDLEGNERLVRADTSGLVIHEISTDGTWLVTKYKIGFEIWGRMTGMDSERNLSWLDFSSNAIVSRDGTMLVIEEESSYAGVTYATCIRKTWDAPVVRLGDGASLDLSPDGKWVISLIYGNPQRLVAYPTGPGEPKEIDPGGLGNYSTARWFPDGKHILICGWKTGDSERCFVTSFDGGPLKAVGPEGTTGRAIIAPDGTRFAIRDTSRRGLVVPLDGGEPLEIKGLTEDDAWIRWSTDGRAILVTRLREIPIHIERLDLESGTRTHVLTIDPSNHDALLKVDDVSLADDGEHYAYEVWRTKSQLFTISGLR